MCLPISTSVSTELSQSSPALKDSLMPLREARLQLVYALIRLYTSQQLSYHLRTTPPSATALASSRLDIAIANTILRITNSLPYLPPYDSENMRPVLNRLFMSLRLGGDGFQQSEEVLHSAYVADEEVLHPTVCVLHACSSSRWTPPSAYHHPRWDHLIVVAFCHLIINHSHTRMNPRKVHLSE